MNKKIKRLLALGLVLGLMASPALADLVIVGQSTGGLTVGTPVTGGTNTRVVFIDGSGNVAGDSDLTFSTDTLSATKITSTGLVVFGSAIDAAASISFNETAGSITWEGAAADTAEARLTHTVNAGFDTVTTIPATGASQTVLVLENAQTITGAKTFSNISGVTLAAGSGGILAENQAPIRFATGSGGGQIQYQTVNTPDSLLLLFGAVSNSINIYEEADGGNDFRNGPCGTSACTDPNIVIHSHTVDTTNYRGYAFYGSAGKAIKTLTEGANTALVRIPVASGAGTGGTLQFTVFASDATDHQTLAGTLYFAAVNKAGTETCTDPTIIGTALNSNSSGTLTCTYECDESPTNAVDLRLSCTSSLSQTTLEAYYMVQLTGPGEPLPQ